MRKPIPAMIATPSVAISRPPVVVTCDRYSVSSAPIAPTPAPSGASTVSMPR
ncbi:Uncharacterised protein [Mycobacteroides abscessus subsp. abscessus]|nr:Uncharacterised protein [Mycobacteroides abscessus subsp. abscessus]